MKTNFGTGYVQAKDFFRNAEQIFDKHNARYDLKVSSFMMLEYALGEDIIDKIIDYTLIMPDFFCREDCIIILERLIFDIIILAGVNLVANKDDAAKNTQNFLENLEKEVNSLFCSRANNQSSLKSQENETNGL